MLIINQLSLCFFTSYEIFFYFVSSGSLQCSQAVAAGEYYTCLNGLSCSEVCSDMYLCELKNMKLQTCLSVSIHYRSIGKGCSVKNCYSMRRMYIPEKMQSGLDLCYSVEEFFQAIIDIAIKIQDTEWRRMGSENVRLIWDISIMFGLTISYVIANKHRDTKELHSINFYYGIVQKMHIIFKSVNSGTVKVIVIVVANENLLRIRKTQTSS